MTTQPNSSRNWELFRHQMPVTTHWSYFDNAAVAPLSLAAHDAIQQWLTEALEEGDTVWQQ